jgi:hypothetical protein
MTPKRPPSHKYALIIIAALLLGTLACSLFSGPAETTDPPVSSEDQELNPTAVTESNGDSLSQALSEMAAGPGFENSLAGHVLCADTLRLIVENDAQEGCHLKINDVRVTQTADANEVWQETWQMTVCGNEYTYVITFTPTSDGGTDISLTR